ncbi:MAG: hypothetical protein ABI175_26655 [Polyangiales bacterium]
MDDTHDANDTIDSTVFELSEREQREPVTLRKPDAYGLSYSERTGFEVLPYDRHGRPIHHHPLGRRAYPTPSEAYAAIRAFEDGARKAA